MKEWKARQYVYHKTTPVFKDQFTSKTNVVVNPIARPGSDMLVSDILSYFHHNPEVLTYPAKSYFVAIVYAYLISTTFDENFYTVLNDPDLLHKNDPYFKTYSQDKATYDRVIPAIPDFGIKMLERGQCPDVVNYFREEFMLETP